MKISIITITYDSAATLECTIKSVLGQTWQDIEYIIIDGASQDGTVGIIERYLPLFRGRLTYISEPDRGIYDAMNKGLEMATGEVVGTLNSDDFYTSPQVLEQVAKSFEDSKIDAIYGDVHYVDKEDLNYCVRYYSARRFRRWHMKLGFMPPHPSFYVRRKLFLEFENYNPNYRIAGDFDLLLRFICVHKISIKYVPMDFVTMRTRGASTSSVRVHLKIMREHLKIFRRNRIYTNVFLLGLRYVCKLGSLYFSRKTMKLQWDWPGGEAIADGEK